jgi:hypothetical protein
MTFLLLWQLLASAAEEPTERLARLETQVVFLSSTVNRIETKLDELSVQEKTKDSSPFTEQWPVALLTVLITLDKAGYYIQKRRNGRHADR